MPQEPSVLKDRWFWLTLIIGGFILSSTLWYGLGMDQAIYAYAAWVWKDYGLPPYVGEWSGDFPGIFILHRLVIELLGESTLGFRFFDLVVQLNCLAAIFYLARRLSGTGVSGLLSSIFYALYYCGLGMLTAERDNYGLWLLLVCAILSLWLERRVWLRALLVGLLLSFVFLLKPTLGFSWLFFGVWFLLEGWRRNRKLVWLELAFFSFCCLSLLGFVVLWYWQIGYLRELYYGPVFYLFKVYLRLSKVTPLGMLKTCLFLFWTIFQEKPAALAGAALGIMVPVLNWSETGRRKIFAVLLGLLAVAAGSFILQTKNVPYHRAPAWGLLMVFSGCGWVWVGNKLKNSAGGWSGRISAGALYFLLGAIMLSSLDDFCIKFGARHYGRSFNRAYMDMPDSVGDEYRAAEFLKPMLKPEDEIVMLGDAPLLPYLLKKKLPSKFTIPILLLLHPYGKDIYPIQKQWMEQYQTEVISARPKFFLIYTWVAKNILGMAEPRIKVILAKEFPRLNQFLHDNYELVTIVDNVEIYVLKSALPEFPGAKKSSEKP